ncbi:MAG TPA: YggT family protein [Burkholderiales bacterium]|nr:YggT family protein [Burkholderiales bacterium]
MLLRIVDLLIVNAFGLIVYTLLLRFYLQLLRAPFRNPVGQFVTALTNWIVLPARRVIPGLMGIDLSTIILAWVLQALMLTLLLWLHSLTLISAPGVATAGLLFGFAAAWLLRASLYLLIGAVILHVLFSWFNPHTPITPVLNALTRPFYGIFQRFIPPIGSVDLSPIFVLIGAQALLFVIGDLVGPF